VAAKKTKDKTEGEEADKDFKFIVRILNTDIDGERKLVDGITAINGINYRIANILARKLNTPLNRKIGSLSDKEVETLTDLIENVTDHVPGWMLNRQKDMDSGEDIHILGTDLELNQKEDINELRKIRCYRGIRHETGHKVRGQRTSSNGRSGAIVGVSRKKR
jgi:small subunit ribosomal protein S13